jgi:hypothetical protein
MQLRAKQFAASLLLTTCVAVCPSLHAQNAADPHWLFKYRDADGTTNANGLMWDKQFKPFINHYLPQRPAFHGWGKPKPMSTIASELFGNSDLFPAIQSGSDRYFIAHGCEAHACPEKGLLWVDLASAPPLVAFAVNDVYNGNDSRAQKLYIFTSRKLSAQDLPKELRATISQWTAKSAEGDYGIKISRAVIVAPDGHEQSADLNAVGVAQTAQEKPE